MVRVWTGGFSDEEPKKLPLSCFVEARADVARLFELPLRIAGRSDIKVVATFEAT